ncbi:MAG: peptidase T [Planctomycetota bacterium]|nr:MAG: peptidase T [Planctomycetota bacterium]
MECLLDRFLRYVRIDTQSDEKSSSLPSTAKQLVLSQRLYEECQMLGLVDVSMDSHGIVMATVPATVKHSAPMIVWNSHVDTSPEYSGTGVNPIVHDDYRGGDLVLPGDPSKILRVQENPHLNELFGRTIVTTDGTTLLGADDKAGIAIIMTAADRLMRDRSIPCGPIRVCFTVDEEVGRGIEGVDFQKLGGVCGYTLDSGGVGRIDTETFSADLAIVTVKGRNTHPSVGKGVMVNAVRILSDFISRLPRQNLSPETTDAREGFMHPYQIQGGVAEATCRIILRDFETEHLARQKELLERIAEGLRAVYSECQIVIETRKQYRNMRDGLHIEPRAIPKAIEAVRAAGIEPIMDIIRGGTDGAQMTERGLPTPNLSSGQYNPHSPLEWTCVEEMETAAKILVELAIAWGKEVA